MLRKRTKRKTEIIGKQRAIMKTKTLAVKSLAISALFLFGFASHINPQDVSKTESDAIKLLVVTGGPTLRHQIDLVPTSFYSLFMGYDDLVWDHASFDEAAFQSEKLPGYDAILMFNRSDSISESSMKKLRQYLESGKGLIVLHHSLGSYNDWEWWWKDVVGAKYQMKETDTVPKSGYKQGEIMKMIRQKDHALTKGIGDFSLNDETYNKLWISKKANVLYRTDNPNSDGPTMWISPFRYSRVVVIQPGHAALAHRDENYRKLIYRTIRWVAEKKEIEA